MIWMPVLAVLVAFAFVTVICAAEFVQDHGPHRVLYRMLTGHHLDGHHRSNRTWLHQGTRAHHEHAHRAHVSRWARTPRLHRAAVAWAAILAIPYTLIGLATERTLTENSWLAAIAGFVLVVMLRLARRIAHRYHRNHVVHPLATALSGHLGLTPAVVQSNLRISPALEAAKPGQRVGTLKNLPDTWHALEADQQWVEAMLSARLPVELEYSWHLVRHPPWLEMLCASAPPAEVLLKDYIPHIEELEPGQYLLGVGADEKLAIWDCLEEDPEGAVGSRTRGGKTNLLSAVIAQGLARDEEFWAVDPKRVSLLHFLGVPGFRLANDPGQPLAMVSLILGFRRQMLDAIAAGDISQHRTLILEEMNVLQPLLDDWWIRTKGPKQRMIDNPAWRAVRDILHMGAQFNHRVMVSGQDLKDKTLFGSRSQFGTILMNRYTAKQWGYTAGTTPVPPTPVRKGRFWLIQGGDPVLIQVLCADARKGHGADNERIWREYALAGRQPEQQVPKYARWYPARVLKAIAAPPAIPGPLALPQVLIGYADAAAYLGMNVDAFRKARQRHPIGGEFSSVVQGRKDPRPKPCWHRDSLDLWRSETNIRDNDARQREDVNAY